ncbi:MAG: cellulase family glycosylhydrolase [Acidimicrobiales bacterium]
MREARTTCGVLRQRPGWLGPYAALTVLVGLGVATGILVGPQATAAQRSVTPSLASPLHRPPSLGNGVGLSGTLRAPGGPFLYDRQGRVVLLHGVNVVYKYPPFEVYPDPHRPWNFSAHDASLMARLGFNVVRLGITWSGLEPGNAPSNDPDICTKGPPGDPGQFDLPVLDRYLAHVRQTVDLLGRYHIYSLIDMHQDVYSAMFGGEGAPSWAVCTGGLPNIKPPGRWSLEYGTRAAGRAFHNLWTNDVEGDLQGELDRVWGYVASYFRSNPWVLGYDPFNEPYSRSVIRLGDQHFDEELECFYTGSAHMGTLEAGQPIPHCPRQDPSTGVIPTILANDPNHLVFFEPDIYGARGFPSFLGSMDLPNLVFNFHVYCAYRSPVTGNPTNIALCAAQGTRSLDRRATDRQHMSSPPQPRGPAWFMSEFGATADLALVSVLTAEADQHLVGWAYWSWKYYGDPTGSRDEALVNDKGQLRPTAYALSRTYPEAISGVPEQISFDPTTGAFLLRYMAARHVRAPTIVFVASALHYPHGYCASASGARVTSAGSDLLEVTNRAGARNVEVRVTSGPCHRS